MISYVSKNAQGLLISHTYNQVQIWLSLYRDNFDKEKKSNKKINCKSKDYNAV